jgi:hypothetical protein
VTGSPNIIGAVQCKTGSGFLPGSPGIGRGY